MEWRPHALALYQGTGFQPCRTQSVALGLAAETFLRPQGLKPSLCPGGGTTKPCPDTKAS